MSLSPSLRHLLSRHAVGGSAWEIIDQSEVTPITGYAVLVALPPMAVGQAAEFTPDQRWQFVCDRAQVVPCDVAVQSVNDPALRFWIVNTTRQPDALICELDLVLFPDRCDVLRPMETTNALRETIITPALHLSDLPCRLQTLGGEDLIVAQRLDTRSTARLRCVRGTDITTSDQITVLGVQYTVTFVHPDTAYRTALAVDLRRLEGQS